MIRVARPETVDQYVEWARSNIAADFAAPAERNRYDANVLNAQNAVQDSAFLRQLPTFLSGQIEIYSRNTGSDLLMSTETTILRKPFLSAVEKSFRKNVLGNRAFPKAPSDGWITPDNWYGKFDDLVRTTMVCKFMDGPKFLAAALDKYAKEFGLTCKHEARGTENGYYAYHHYTAFPVPIVDLAWKESTVSLTLEIQLTTQLQEVLRKITHPLYEKSRLTSPRQDQSWKWDHVSSRFKTSYLGHTLHLIEAVILQARDAEQGAESESEAMAEPPPPSSATDGGTMTGRPPSVSAADGETREHMPTSEEQEDQNGEAASTAELPQATTTVDNVEERNEP